MTPVLGKSIDGLIPKGRGSKGFSIGIKGNGEATTHQRGVSSEQAGKAISLTVSNRCLSQAPLLVSMALVLNKLIGGHIPKGKGIK